VEARQLIDPTVAGGKVTEAGFRLNIDVALQYLSAWLRENGAVAIHNLMEDAATAEISRAQLWQWIKAGTKLDDGRPVTAELYQSVRHEELSRLTGAAAAPTEGGGGSERYEDAAKLLDRLVSSDDFAEFLTIPAYALLD
jgi:malate synthase